MNKKQPIKKFKGFKREDGTYTREAWFDGYCFGDRLLEGVMFKALIKDDGSMTVSVGSQSDYFSTLNESKWLKIALEFAQEYDIFQEFEFGGGEDLYLTVEN